MDRYDLILQELQMITGTISNDYDYLVSLLLRKEKDSKVVKRKFEIVELPNVTKVPSIDSWFSSLGGVCETK